METFEFSCGSVPFKCFDFGWIGIFMRFHRYFANVSILDRLEFSCGSINVVANVSILDRLEFPCGSIDVLASVSILGRLEFLSPPGFRFCVVWNFQHVESIFLQYFGSRFKEFYHRFILNATKIIYIFKK